MYCRSCAKECPDQAIACTGCGVAPLTGNKFCNSCGGATAENAIICVNCGCGLGNSNKETVSFGSDSGGGANPNPVSSGTAILWYLVCYPVGYSQWGQSTKGWVSLLALILTGGFAGILLLVDYIMCYKAQKTRTLGEWDFFPKA